MSKCQTCGAPIDLGYAAMQRIAFSGEDWKTCFCNIACRDAAVVVLMIAAEGNSTGEEFGIDAGTREAVAAMVPLDEDAAPPEQELRWRCDECDIDDRADPGDFLGKQEVCGDCGGTLTVVAG